MEEVINLSEKEISQRVFPIRSEVKTYVNFVENVENDSLRNILKLILCSGFRITEILNSFILQDSLKNVYYIKGYALKSTQVTNFKFGKRKFAGSEELKKDLKLHPERFKTVPLFNIFNLDVREIYSFSNDVDTEIQRLRPLATFLNEKEYNRLYRILKKETSNHVPFRVYYMNSKLSAIEKEVNIIPSFHFFRKLFVSELYFKLNKDIVYTVEYMKWSNLKRILDYSKAYDDIQIYQNLENFRF